jgi:hypothetical protein
MTTKRSIKNPPARKEDSTTCQCRLREKLSRVISLTSDDAGDALKFADALKRLAARLCSLHLEQKALFDFKWDYSEPSESTSFSEDFDAAHEAMGELECEILAGIERQRALIAELELRATLLQAKLGFKGTVVPRG